MAQLWSPSTETLGKMPVFSPYCGDKTVICPDRAKRNRGPYLPTYRCRVSKGQIGMRKPIPSQAAEPARGMPPSLERTACTGHTFSNRKKAIRLPCCAWRGQPDGAPSLRAFIPAFLPCSGGAYPMPAKIPGRRRLRQALASASAATLHPGPCRVPCLFFHLSSCACGATSRALP